MLGRGLIGVIQVYRLSLSAVVGRQCRFYPSCSEYMQQAIARHGAGKGLILGCFRVCRCGPGGGHGFDPVPEVWHDAFRRRDSQPSAPE